jgi:pimeloyl-ACP methyl ester carboxylesterase
MAETRSKGIRIDYGDCGQGEPALLFLPGWCASRAKYAELADRISGAHRTLALDWRGHGTSERTTTDFGEEALVQDALAVVEASGVRQVVPISTAHAGWVGIEMRRRLGARVPKLVLIDWLVLDAPPPFLGALRGIQDSTQWQATRDRMFAMWLEGVEDTRVIRFVRDDMGSYSAAMWARAGREIAAAYMRHGSPLAALTALDPPVPTLHLYAQPTDPAFLQAQETFAAEHSWFQVQKLHAHSHFPSIEVPDQVAAAINRFLG